MRICLGCRHPHANSASRYTHISIIPPSQPPPVIGMIEAEKGKRKWMASDSALMRCDETRSSPCAVMMGCKQKRTIMTLLLTMMVGGAGGEGASVLW